MEIPYALGKRICDSCHLWLRRWRHRLTHRQWLHQFPSVFCSSLRRGKYDILALFVNIRNDAVVGINLCDVSADDIIAAELQLRWKSIAFNTEQMVFALRIYQVTDTHHRLYFSLPSLEWYVCVIFVHAKDTLSTASICINHDFMQYARCSMVLSVSRKDMLNFGPSAKRVRWILPGLLASSWFNTYLNVG